MTTVTKTAEPVVTRISGPIVTAAGMYAAQMYEVVANIFTVRPSPISIT